MSPYADTVHLKMEGVKGATVPELCLHPFSSFSFSVN